MVSHMPDVLQKLPETPLFRYAEGQCLRQQLDLDRGDILCLPINCKNKRLVPGDAQSPAAAEDQLVLQRRFFQMLSGLIKIDEPRNLRPREFPNGTQIDQPVIWTC